MLQRTGDRVRIDARRGQSQHGDGARSIPQPIGNFMREGRAIPIILYQSRPELWR